MGSLLASLFPTVAKCSLIMLGIREPFSTILLRLLKSFSADITFKFCFRLCKSSLIPCQVFSCWPCYFQRMYSSISFDLIVSMCRFCVNIVYT